MKTGNVILSTSINKYSILNIPSTCVAQDDEKELVHLTMAKDDLSRLLDKEMKCRVEFPDKDKKEVVIKDIRPEEDKLFLTCRLK